MRRRTPTPHPATLLPAVLLLLPAPALAQEPTVSVEPVVAEVEEGSTPLQVAIRLSHPAPGPASVRVRTVAETADATDVAPLDRTVSFGPGQTSALLPITVVDDAFDEPLRETLMVVLSEPRGVIPGHLTATLTIRDDDEALDVSVAPAGEGGTARVVVQREWPSALPVTLQIELGPGSATAADYALVDPVATLQPDDLTADFGIAILEDDEEELAEAFIAEIDVVSATPGGTVLLTPPSLPVPIPADERREPDVSDRAFRAELGGEIQRLVTGPFERRDEYIGHAPSSSCEYRTAFEADGWTFTVSMELPHLEPGETYPVRSPIVRDGDDYVVRRLVDGAVKVSVQGPGLPGPGTYYGVDGTLTFSRFDARFGRHPDRPVAGRLQAALERVEFDTGDHPYAVTRREMTTLGTATLDLTFASDRALLPNQMGDCGRPE